MPRDPMAEDIVATDELTVTLLQQALHVGRVSPGALQGCAWPLLKSMFGGAEGDEGDYLPRGFFSLMQEEGELTLVLDERCRAAFDEAVSVASVEYAPHQWYAFELHLGSLAWEVPGLVCHLATLMAESDISILNLSSHDRDFLLVRESDVGSAKQVIQQRLQVPHARAGRSAGMPPELPPELPLFSSLPPVAHVALARRARAERCGRAEGGDVGEGERAPLGRVLVA